MGQLVPRDDLQSQLVPRLLDYLKGRLRNAVAIGAGGTDNVDLTTTGFARLMVIHKMTGGAIGDLSTAVRPYEYDGVAVGGGGGPAIQVARDSGVLLSGGVVGRIASYDLDGVDKVQIRSVNNNVGAQTLTVDYYLQR